ncbi:MAG: hypothetical protein AAGH38_06035, partial [Pseudomonadota bacterium]
MIVKGVFASSVGAIGAIEAIEAIATMKLAAVAAAAALSLYGTANAQALSDPESPETQTMDTVLTDETAVGDGPNVVFEAEVVPEDLFARDTYQITPMVCPFKGKIEYDPEHTSCGRLAVPETREKSQSRTIQLNYVKLEAREPEDWDEEEDGEWSRRDDPIVYLTGGPGAVASGYVDRFKDHGVRDHRDLYILEQR